MVSYRGEGLYLVLRRNTTLGYDGKTQNVNLLFTFQKFLGKCPYSHCLSFHLSFLTSFHFNLVILRDIPLFKCPFLFEIWWRVWVVPSTLKKCTVHVPKFILLSGDLNGKGKNGWARLYIMKIIAVAAMLIKICDSGRGGSYGWGWGGSLATFSFAPSSILPV